MIPILYLSHYRSIIGGGERQLLYLTANLDKTRFQPIVVCPNEGPYVHQLRRAKVSTSVMKLPPWRKTVSLLTRHLAVIRLTDLAKKHNIQLIHSADSWLNPYANRIKRRLDIPVVSHVPNLLTPEQVHKYECEFMDRFISISEQGKKPLADAGISSQKIEVVTNCVDLSMFKPDSIQSRSDSDLFVVGIVGRIEPFKRQKSFIEIARQVNQQCDNVRFHIIGSSPDTNRHRIYENEVRRSVLDYKLQDVVYFMGHRNDMPKAMTELDLLVTLSAGSVIAEAMACGKPVIGTTIGSTADMIVDGETGYILPEDAIDLISGKIIHLVRNLDNCRQIGNTARKHAERNFSIEKYVQRIQAIYETLVSFD